MYTASDADGTGQKSVSGAGILIKKTAIRENIGRIKKMSDVFSLKCLRCGNTYGIPETDMRILGYTKYSYCENCLREGLELLNARDEAEELRQPFYVIDTPANKIQTYDGRPMAFKKKIVAEWQIQETERLMRKNGFSNLCGIMFVRPMTLETCGKSKHHFLWLDKTIGEMEDKEESE